MRARSLLSIAGALAHGVRNRSTGLVAGARRRLSHAPVPDDVQG